MSYSSRYSSASSANKRYPKRNFTNSNNRSRGNSNRGRNSVYIDPARFIKPATASQEEAYVPTHKFIDFDLHEVLQANLSAKGYEIPSPIQDQAIPAALEGKDIIGIASTGTGKTAAFALPMLNKLIADPQSKALIIAPTRELAQQIEDECRSLGKGTRLFSALLIGGAGMGNQLRDLRQNPRVVIGTPGRIKDHIERGTLKLAQFNTIVLDEVDRMLDMGFVNDVTEILSNTSSNRQSLFFSATMDHKVRSLINNFSNDPFTVSLKPSSASANVHQNVVRYQTTHDKLDKLHDILIKDDVSKVVVFDETQRGVERLFTELQSRGFSAESLHGGKSQGQRERALAKFKTNKINILVATDVAARGLDVADISHVINYSLPNNFDDYIHRIGRAGRAGQTGHALTFIAH